jgi:hypothetical protein
MLGRFQSLDRVVDDPANGALRCRWKEAEVNVSARLSLHSKAARNPDLRTRRGQLSLRLYQLPRPPRTAHIFPPAPFIA